MIEKVNPKHPDKIADRIAGAIVDIAYKQNSRGLIAVEVLIGYGVCHTIVETNLKLDKLAIKKAIKRIGGSVEVDLVLVKEDKQLERNQAGKIICEDNGIFRGVPLADYEKKLVRIAKDIYNKYNTNGKYILHNDKLIIRQSNAKEEDLRKEYPNAIINPLGYWTEDTNVGIGCTNRKLGSDMAKSVTGGGLHGKALVKADIAVSIYAFLKAQETGKEQEFSCVIGDEYIDGVLYEDIIKIAENYIKELGGFEKFAEWGLVYNV